MPGNHDPFDDELDDRRERDVREDDPAADDDQEHRVAHRPNPLPAREEDEEELAEADILEELDLDDIEDDDLDFDELVQRGRNRM